MFGLFSGLVDVLHHSFGNLIIETLIRVPSDTIQNTNRWTKNRNF